MSESTPAMAADEVEVAVKATDMPEELLKEVIELMKEAFTAVKLEKDIAEFIKKRMDEKHGPVWHCIVGKSFGSYVTHEQNSFAYVYLHSHAVLVFRAGG